ETVELLFSNEVVGRDYLCPRRERRACRRDGLPDVQALVVAIEAIAYDAIQSNAVAAQDLLGQIHMGVIKVSGPVADEDRTGAAAREGDHHALSRASDWVRERPSQDRRAATRGREDSSL